MSNGDGSCRTITVMPEETVVPGDYLIRKNIIEELITQEVMNSIKLLLENDSFFWITQRRGFFRSSWWEILS